MDENTKEALNVLSGLEKRRFIKWISILIFLVSIFVISQTMIALKEYKYIGSGVNPTNVITVSGKGEVFAVPDIATFTFSSSEDAKTVKDAQDKVTQKINTALNTLKKDYGIEDKDIKTVDYSVYPKYEYVGAPCYQFSCPPSKQNLVGYTVSQTISVKVRKVTDAGNILGAMGEVGVTNISGLNFTIDDEDVLTREARQEAIKDAQSKADALSRDLGVSIVRIVSFSESGNYPIYYSKSYDVAMVEGGRGGAPTPEVPVGENKITSNVTITYEIR